MIDLLVDNIGVLVTARKAPWRFGDEIVVHERHVLETSDPKDMRLASLLAATMSAKDAAMQWRELRLMEGIGVQANLRTIFILPDVN